MNRIFAFFLIGAAAAMTGFNTRQSNVEFVCMKVLKAKNECHYNFLVDGAKFRYIDFGCKRKKEDVIEKIQNGDLPLGKDWKIECPMPKAN